MTERTLEDLQAENERLKLALENAQLEKQGLEVELDSATLIANTLLAQAQAARAVEDMGPQAPQLQINAGPESQRQVIPEQPKGPGGAPVPRAPLGANPGGPPKAGEMVRVTCRAGTTIRATGQRCEGKIQKLQGMTGDGDGITGGGGRRVIYVCQTCNQPWHIVY